VAPLFRSSVVLPARRRPHDQDGRRIPKGLFHPLINESFEHAFAGPGRFALSDPASL